MSYFNIKPKNLKSEVDILLVYVQALETFVTALDNIYKVIEASGKAFADMKNTLYNLTQEVVVEKEELQLIIDSLSQIIECYEDAEKNCILFKRKKIKLY